MAKKILFVDDEIDVMRVTIFRLQKAGYEVVTASDGLSVLELLKKTAFDLVILDIRMPGIPGDQVCKNIKSDDQLKHTPVILFTASIQKLEEKVGEARADSFLMKPFEPEQLLEKVKKLIG